MGADTLGGPTGPARDARSKPDRALRSTFGTNVALSALGAATGILAARLLGPSGEGELAAIQTWPLLLASLAMLGLPEALVYFISGRPERGRQFTSTAVLLGLLSALAVGAAAWHVLPFLLHSQRQPVVAAAQVFLLVGCMFALFGIPHGSLRGARAFTAWNLLRAAPGFAWLCILATSSFIGHTDAIHLSRWFLVGLLASGVPSLVVANRRLEGPLKPDPGLAPGLLRFGLPSMLTSIPQTLNLRFDQLLIIALLPAQSLGFYVAAVAWGGAVPPLLSAAGSVLFPHVSAEQNAGRQGSMVATALQGGVLAAVAASVLFMVLAPFGLPLVFGSRFAPSVPSALVLVPAGAVLAWSGIAEEGLRGLGHPTVVLIAEVVAAVVTLATLPVLLVTNGIFGAAIASLLGYSTVAAFTVIAVSRLTHQPVRSLVIPTWPVTKALAARGLSLLRRQPSGGGRDG